MLTRACTHLNSQTMAEQLKLDYDEMMQKAEALHKTDPSLIIPKVALPGE